MAVMAVFAGERKLAKALQPVRNPFCPKKHAPEGTKAAGHWLANAVSRECVARSMQLKPNSTTFGTKLQMPELEPL